MCKIFTFILLFLFIHNNIQSQICAKNVRVFVFGDSHTKGGLGISIGNELKKINPSISYEFYGENGAGFTNNFNSNKSKLLVKIKNFNPNIVICVLGTNEMPINRLNYESLLKTIAFAP